MAELQDAAQPALASIKPGVKSALNETDSLQFEICITTNDPLKRSPVTLRTREHGRVSCVDHAMSPDECSALCRLMDSSAHLSFWNEQGRENENARQFRDADTVEVNLPAMAAAIWDRVSEVFDKTPIVIRHDDTEHVRVHIDPSTCLYLRTLDMINIMCPLFSTLQTNAQWERELPGEWHPCGLNNNFLFARYPEGGHFAPHTDGRVIHGKRGKAPLNCLYLGFTCSEYQKYGLLITLPNFLHYFCRF